MEATHQATEQEGKRFRVGQTASLSKTITETDVVWFAGLIGDFSPIHVNAEYAKHTRFKARIAHGMLSASLISSVLGTRLPGAGTLYLGQQLKFLAPVYIGDTVTAVAEILKIREDKPIITLRTDCFNQHGQKVVEGEAVVLAAEENEMGAEG